MTVAIEAPAPSEPASDPDPPANLDPEADAEAALQTLRQFVLDDVPADAPPLATWHGLDAYIDELCAYGVGKLSREPDDLHATSLRLKNDLEEVSCGNYRALIESFECAGAVRKGVADVRARLDDLVAALPKLADATRHFSANVHDKQRERERWLRAITEHRAIADILEMPRLMGTLIAAELYDEALELRENAVKLAVMHPDERLICDVCAEVDVLTQQMVLRLLMLLRKSVQLPMCLRVVGFLRRLAVFSEFRLRMLFLQCRGEWMRAEIESTTAATQQAHLVSLSDGTRAMIFEIVTQYRAVFSDDSAEDDDDFDEAVQDGEDGSHTLPSAILYDWTSSCISEYLERLERGVKDIRDGAALNTVLQQAMYCGQSLGRVGADFRSALPPIFEEAVLRIYSSLLNAALRQFEMMIEDNRWAPVGSSALRKERGEPFGSIESSASPLKDGAANGAGEGGDGGDGEQYDPPVGVLDSPPLAVFLNGILAALNELRLCAPVSLSARLGEALQETLISAGEYMSAVGGPGGAFLKRSDRPHFISMSASLRDLCVQHAARCLDYCMNRSGLVDVDRVREVLAEVFGESTTPVSLSRETVAKLNGTDDAGEPALADDPIGSQDLKGADQENAYQVIESDPAGAEAESDPAGAETESDLAGNEAETGEQGQEPTGAEPQASSDGAAKEESQVLPEENGYGDDGNGKFTASDRNLIL